MTLRRTLLCSNSGDSPNARFDPLFSQVELLLHLAGPEGTQEFNDSSNRARTPFSVGIDPQYSTTVPGLFASTSAYCSSTYSNGRSFIRYSTDSTFNLGTQNFTIEFAVYQTQRVGLQTANCVVFGFGLQATAGVNVYFSTGTNGIPSFNVLNNNTALFTLSGSTAIPLNTWTRIAITRTTNTFRLFVNGIIVATGTYTGTLTTNSAFFSLGAMYRGGNNTVYCFVGYTCEWRITVGASRYTANYTLDTLPFPNR